MCQAYSAAAAMDAEMQRVERETNFDCENSQHLRSSIDSELVCSSI